MKITKINKKNMNYSIKDGASNSIKVGFGQSYISAYAVLLGATNLQIGFLKSIPQLIGAISQLFSSSLTEFFGSRKKLFTTSAFLEALVWIPVILTFFIVHEKVWFLILFATIYWIVAYVGAPAWGSLMGDVVPDGIKGKYFGKRNRITNLSAFISTVIAGLLLQFFSRFNPIYGFIVIFSIAMIARLISWNYLRKLIEPELFISKESKFSFIDFVKRMNSTNYGIFVIYLSMMTFAVNISSPYSVVYLLKDLDFNYVTYMSIISASTISSFLFMGLWGKYSDTFGNKKILTLTGYLIPFIPLLWLLSPDPYYLIAIKIFSGFAWAGFNLSSFNFVFDLVSRQKRVRCISYYRVLNGIALFLGATMGGYLIRYGNMFLYNFYLLLVVSFVLRFLISFGILSRIREVRWVKRASETKILWSIGTEVFEDLKHPVVVLMDKRVIIKKRWERILEAIEKIIGKALGTKHEYS